MGKVKVKIIEWNARGVRFRFYELAAVIEDYDPDIIIIIESWIEDGESFSFGSWQSYLVGRRGRNGGGVLALVRKGIEVSNLKTSDPEGGGNVEWLSFETKLVDGTTMTLAGVYVPDGDHHCPNFDWMSDLQGPLVVCGDFNAHHKALGPMPNRKYGNVAGNATVRLLQDEGLVLLSEGVPTHVKGGQLDLWMASRDMADLASPVTVSPHCYNSDHMVTAIEFQPAACAFPTLRYCFNRANWNLFSALLSNRLNEIRVPVRAMPAEIERYNEQITEAIKWAADRAIPKVAAKDLPTYKPTKEMRALIRRRHQFERQYDRTQDPTFKVQADDAYQRFKRLVDVEEEKALFKKMEAMERARKTNLSQFFRLYNQVASGDGCSRGTAIRPLQAADGSMVTSDAGRAELFRECYGKQLNPPVRTEADTEIGAHHARIEAAVKDDPDSFAPIDTDQLDRRVYIGRAEFRAAVTRLKLKAPGMDNISNLMLKRGGPTLWGHLRRLYNLSLACGYLPMVWKIAVIVPLPRAGKDLRSPGGYRPVSLLPTIAKLLELIMALRLRELFRRNRLIPDHQSGFQQHRSTTDQTFRVSQARAMTRCRRHVMIAVMLDFEGAFNAVWHNALRVKLRNCDAVPKPMVRWLSSFLSGRSFVVRVGSAFSEKTDIGSGVPQGSALSPILFAFFTGDILPDNNADETKAFPATYADDLTLFAMATYTGLAQVRAKTALDRVARWSRLWRLPLSPTKCQVLRFGGKKSDRVNLYVGNERLPVVPTSRYLGIIFDDAGTWIPHLDAVVLDAKKRLGGLRRVCGPKSKLSLRSRRMLYVATIRPVLEYSCAAWLDASPTQLSRLEVIQNDCLRAVLGVSRVDHVDGAELARRAELPTLPRRWCQLAASFAGRCLNAVPPVGRMIQQDRAEFGVCGSPLGYFRHQVPFGPFNGGIADR